MFFRKANKIAALEEEAKIHRKEMRRRIEELHKLQESYKLVQNSAKELNQVQNALTHYQKIISDLSYKINAKKKEVEKVINDSIRRS